MSHLKRTKGGVGGHIVRRATHVLTLPLLLLLYYSSGAQQHIDHRMFAGIAVVLVLVFEGLRIRYRKVFFGMRDFERHRLASYAYSLLGLFVMLWITADWRSVTPIVAQAALIDPISGELKNRLSRSWLWFILILVSALVWSLVGYWWCGWPLIYGAAVCPVVIAADFIPWNSWDDNITMLLLPFFTLGFMHLLFG